MKKEKLLQAIGNLPDDMILEAKPQEQVPGRKRSFGGIGCIKEQIVEEAENPIEHEKPN